MSDERTQLLLQRYFDQVLTGEERSELSTMLLASPRARDEFWELARWNALIRQWGEAEWGRRDAEEITLRPLPAVQAPAQPAPKSVIVIQGANRAPDQIIEVEPAAGGHDLVVALVDRRADSKKR